MMPKRGITKLASAREMNLRHRRRWPRRNTWMTTTGGGEKAECDMANLFDADLTRA